MTGPAVVEPIDVDDGDRFPRWHRCYLDAERDHRAMPNRPTARELRLRFQDVDEPAALWWAREGDLVVGALVAGVFATSNPDLGWADVRVLPAARGRGLGAALLDRAVDHVRHQGRSRVVGEVIEPLDLPAGSTPGGRFARAHGFEVALEEQRNVVELPVATDLLDQLDASTRQRRGAYTVELFNDHCPDDLVDSMCACLSRFNTEAPSGDLHLEADPWDVDRLRRAERRRVEQGHRTFVALALDPERQVVGYTQMWAPPDEDGRVGQADTLVDPSARGHGLGLAMKVANLRALQQQRPDRTYVGTWNSPTNVAMVAVNRALGMRPRERMLGVQRRWPAPGPASGPASESASESAAGPASTTAPGPGSGGRTVAH